MSEYCAVPEQSREIDRELATLEAELKRLEAEYNMYFAGRLPRPPWETRTRVEGMVKRLDRMHIANTGDRFRFSGLQARYAKFIDLWDRALRAREEGRAGPLTHLRKPPPPQPAAKKEKDRVVHVTTVSDPGKDADKIRELYDNLADARRAAGQESIPYHKFAELVRTQVDVLKKKGSAEVDFRIAVKDGQVAFSARGTKKKE